MGSPGGRDRRVLADYLVILVKKVDMEKEAPKVLLDSEVRKDARG